MTHVVLHTDGGSRGNPGPAAIGVVLAMERDGRREVVRELGEVIGTATNNVAEYRAIIRGLEEARSMGAESVTCLLDSQLVVEQLNGRYKVRHPDMLPLFQQVRALMRDFTLVTFAHVPREQNQAADRLVNTALDGRPSRPRRPAPEPEPEGISVSWVPQWEWSPLPRPGCAGVEGRVLLRAEWGDVTMLRFSTAATIDEHAAAEETEVICLEGAGFASIDGAEAPIAAGQAVRWPPGRPHRLWTKDQTMTTLMVSRRPAPGTLRGHGEPAR